MSTSLDRVVAVAKHPARFNLGVVAMCLLVVAGLIAVVGPKPPVLAWTGDVADALAVRATVAEVKTLGGDEEEADLGYLQMRVFFRRSRMDHLARRSVGGPPTLEETPFLDAQQPGRSAVAQRSQPERAAALQYVLDDFAEFVESGEFTFAAPLRNAEDRALLEAALEDFDLTMKIEGSEELLPVASSEPEPLGRAIVGWMAIGLALLTGLAGLALGGLAWRLTPIRVELSPTRLRLGRRDILLEEITQIGLQPRLYLTLRNGQRVRLGGRQLAAADVADLAEAWEARLPTGEPVPAVADPVLQDLRERV